MDINQESLNLHYKLQGKIEDIPEKDRDKGRLIPVIHTGSCTTVPGDCRRL